MAVDSPYLRRRGPGAGLALCAALLALLVPSAALGADDPTSAQYDSTLDQISQGNGQGGPADPGETGTGTGGGSAPPSGDPGAGSALPFTGFDAAAMAVVAIALGLGGVAMRRRALATGASER
jgi:hypothetical protein